MGGRRRLVVVSVAAAALIVAGAFALDSAGSSAPPGTAESGATARPSAAERSAAPTATATSATPTPSAAPNAAAPPAEPEPETPVADPVAPLEVLPPAPVETGLPASVPRPALVALPFPAASGANGRLVTGFPETVGPLDGSIVSTSSLAPDGSILRGGFTATVPLDGQAITESYRSALGALGFTSSDVATVGGGTSTVFTSGDDSVSLATTPTGTERTSYTIVAVLHAVDNG